MLASNQSQSASKVMHTNLNTNARGREPRYRLSRFHEHTDIVAMIGTSDQSRLAEAFNILLLLLLAGMIAMKAVAPVLSS